jgi:hypothetical protein
MGTCPRRFLGLVLYTRREHARAIRTKEKGSTGKSIPVPRGFRHRRLFTFFDGGRIGLTVESLGGRVAFLGGGPRGRLVGDLVVSRRESGGCEWLFVDRKRDDWEWTDWLTCSEGLVCRV